MSDQAQIAYLARKLSHIAMANHTHKTTMLAQRDRLIEIMARGNLPRGKWVWYKRGVAVIDGIILPHCYEIERILNE